MDQKSRCAWELLSPRQRPPGTGTDRTRERRHCQLGTISREVEGGRLRVVLDQDGKVLRLKRENPVEVQQGQEGNVASNRAGKHTATQHRTCARDGDGDEQLMLVYNFYTLKGFRRRTTLERGMRDWFDKGKATTNKCVLCGPGGIGNSTLILMCI